MSEPYVPIDCGLHDRLEVLALHGDLLDVTWTAPGDEGHRQMTAVRLRTWRSEGGKEVGVFVGEGGSEHRIRLDHLVSVRPRGGAEPIHFTSGGSETRSGEATGPGPREAA